MADRPHLVAGRIAAPLVLAAALLTVAAPARAQSQELGENCEIQRARVLVSNVNLGGQRLTRIGQPVVVCDDGVRVQADSAVHYHQTGRTEFIGSFRYGDPERELRAREADYFEEQGRLFARGDVELLPREGGSEIRGDSLTLLEGAEGAADDQIVVRGEPAFASVVPTETATPDAPAAPYRVTALQIRFQGDRYMYADGLVELQRDSLEATARSLVFDQVLGELTLTGEARMQTEEADLAGEEIRLALPEDAIEGIVVTGDGRLQTDDLELTGHEIHIGFANDEIQELVAVRQASTTPDDPGAVEPAETAAGVGAPRPTALTETFVLTADSLNIRTPEGVLDSVYAIGAARGEGREAQAPVDSLAALTTEPADSEGADDMSSLLLRDWIEGDTIIATFSSAEPDETAENDSPSYRMDRLVARGNARTLYRSPPEEEAAPGEDAPPPPAERDRWAISYTLADTIALTMSEGRVDHVEAVGNVTGFHGEPIPPPERPAEESEQPAAAAPAETDGEPDRTATRREAP